ncbi:hypothetical protein B5M09_003152 [Aphanomyces astaci]|uniref:Uncharacterized protein n=1 Tax=Aphanomyces astaci TaxID=112090 RepID=A0A3R7ZA62_APHAT|nr:hypothetical protein B5M09_003152 [Aphanomyces astaci]
MTLSRSSLAKHRNLTQWFPLEKAVPGDVVRGEVRMSFHYQEEVAAITTIETIPPPNTQRKQVASIDAYSSDIPFRKKERQSRPGLPSPQTHEPKARPDKRTPAATVATTVSPEKKKMLMSNSPSKIPDPLASNQAIANNDDSSSSRDVDTPTPHPYLKRKPYRIRFEKLDWSSVASKTDSNVPKAVPQQPPTPAPPSEQVPEKTGASLEQLMSAHNQRNLALVHLKQKAELHAIFHLPPPPSVLPTLTRPALGQLHRLPIGDTTRRLERHYDLLRQKIASAKRKESAKNAIVKQKKSAVIGMIVENNINS